MDDRNTKKTWSLRTVSLQEDFEKVMGGQDDQQGSDGGNEQGLESNDLPT